MVVSCRGTDAATAAVVSCRWSCSGDELQGAAAMDCRRDLRWSGATMELQLGSSSSRD